MTNTLHRYSSHYAPEPGDDVPAVLACVREVARRVDTVIALGVSTRCGAGGDEPLRALLEREGYPTYRGKTNLGLGRVTVPGAKVPARPA